MDRLFFAGRLLVGPVAALVVIAMMASGALPTYQGYSVALACIYGIIVLSVSLLAGWAGVWSVGQPAMVAIGAYTAAAGSAHGWPLEVVLVVAVGLATLAGAFLGFAGARFSALYIALLTLIFNLVALEIINHWRSVTGGDEGVSVLDISSVTGLTLHPGSDHVLRLCVASLGIMASLAVLMRRTTLRMRMQAAKSHIAAARSVGISPAAQTALAFGVSAGVASFAGVLLALGNGFVGAEVASLTFGINIVAATVLGGVGTVIGAVLGGAFLTWSPSWAASVGVPQQAMQGVLLILALIFIPRGLASILNIAWARVRRWLGRTSVRVEHPETTDIEPTGGAAERVPRIHGPVLLEARAVEVRFGGLRALRDVNLTVDQGEVLGIIGPNGAGKTTLLNVLSGLLPKRNTSGDVIYDGSRLPFDGDLRRSAAGIGRTFQHAELFSELTVLENVLASRRRVRRADRRRAFELLESLGLLGVADELPPNLSFGVQKRVDLARALFGRPRLLLMDEPFGGLDNDERALLTRAIRRLRDGGLSVVIIDHVLEDLTAVADRFLAFDFGTPLTDGSAAEVLADERVKASYLGGREAAALQPRTDGERVPLLALESVHQRYGGVVALTDVDIEVVTGTVLGIVGANGAGKSTVGRLLAGQLQPTAGRRVVHHAAGGSGRVVLVPEGRALFRTLTVRENLEVSAYAAGSDRARRQERLEEVLEWLPEKLRDRLEARAGALSGGEQQMLAIARALMAEPTVLILDEPSLGLAPALVDEVYERIGRLAESGITVVLLEQLLSRALARCHHVLVLRDGRVVAVGGPDEPGFASAAEHAYFGHELQTAP